MANADVRTGLAAELFRRLEAKGLPRVAGKGAPVEWETETGIDRSNLDRWLKALDEGAPVRIGKGNLRRVTAYLGRVAQPQGPEERRAIIAVLDELQAKLDELRRIYVTEEPIELQPDDYIEVQD